MDEKRWPRVIGMIGIILGALIAIDQFDDLLLHVWWSEADWARFLGPDLADLIVLASGPTWWRVLSSIAELCLGILLLVASLRVFNRRRSGASLSKTWAWLAIAFTVVELGTAVLLLNAWSEQLALVAGHGWESWASFGLWAALAVMLTWPLFLLFWLGRSSVRSEVEAWPA